MDGLPVGPEPASDRHARLAIQRAEGIIRQLAGTPIVDGLYDTETSRGDIASRAAIVASTAD